MNDEIEQIAARFYRKRFWVIETTPVAGGPDPGPIVAAHLRYQIELEKSGILFAAGPLSTAAGDMTGAGLMILRGENEAEMRRVADADPMHASGARCYVLRQWHAHEGRISISIDLSDSSYRLD
jgi:uncharacterized protein YciI